MQNLVKRYKEAEKYMDNFNIIIEKREKHLDKFVKLTKELANLTKNMTVDEIRALMEW